MNKITRSATTSGTMLTTLACFALATASAGAAADERRVDEQAKKRDVLQVQVQIPPSWTPMFEDDITEAFVARIQDVFRSQDFAGKIEHVTSFDEPDPGCCLLTINLIEWRVNHIGNIECVFTASLQTEETTRNLGIFSDTTFRWMSGPGRFGLADAFGDAAEGAARQLYRQLARTELVPGLR